MLAKTNCKDLGVNFMNINLENQQTEIADKVSHINLNLVECA
jgi:hypothetical protein